MLMRVKVSTVSKMHLKNCFAIVLLFTQYADIAYDSALPYSSVLMLAANVQDSSTSLLATQQHNGSNQLANQTKTATRCKTIMYIIAAARARGR